MIRDSEIQRAQQSAMTPDQARAEARAEERARWRAAFDHPNAAYQQAMVASLLASSDMSVQEIHKVLAVAPRDPDASVEAPAPIDQMRDGESVAKELLRGSVGPVALNEFVTMLFGEQDRTEYADGQRVAKALLAKYDLH